MLIPGTDCLANLCYNMGLNPLVLVMEIDLRWQQHHLVIWADYTPCSSRGAFCEYARVLFSRFVVF